MRKNRFAAFGGGAIIGTLGGLIGLGGAEFRLPLLIGVFGFASLEAVILNKAMSIVVVSSALPFRAGTIPFSILMDHWGVILNLLAGSLSLAISLPTILTGFSRYSKDQSFAVVGRNRYFVLVMAVGSLFGAFLGGQLVGIVPANFLLPLLAVIPVISAIKVWRHR